MNDSLKFLAIPLAVGALVFAGCGGSDSSDDSSSTETSTSQPAESNAGSGESTNGAAQTLALAADPSGALAYDTDKLSATAGDVTLDFTNDSPVPHDVVIDDAKGNEVGATEVITGSSASTEFSVKPGEYTFFCSVPGHEAGGMKGTLTVK